MAAAPRPGKGRRTQPRRPCVAGGRFEAAPVARYLRQARGIAGPGEPEVGVS